MFEHGRMPLHKMLQAVYLMTSSKKGISAHQLHRVLEVTYKTAWFLAHRIREAMRTGELAPMGGAGGVVEAECRTSRHILMTTNSAITCFGACNPSAREQVGAPPNAGNC